MTDYALRGINPEPWTAPSVAVSKVGPHGRARPIVYKSEALRAYQEAVKHELRIIGATMAEPGALSVTFYFWRELPAYTTERQRKARKHVADATNLQKALEDACQGILFDNDRDNVHVETWIVEQDHDTEPRILICVEPAVMIDVDHLPDVFDTVERRQATAQPKTEQPDYDTKDVF